MFRLGESRLGMILNVIQLCLTITEDTENNVYFQFMQNDLRIWVYLDGLRNLKFKDLQINTLDANELTNANKKLRNFYEDCLRG